MRLAQSPAVFAPVGAARLKPHLELAIDTAPVEMPARNVVAVGARPDKGGEAVAGMRPQRASGIVDTFFGCGFRCINTSVHAGTGFRYTFVWDLEGTEQNN